uniref:Harmonin-binding protein USHBP1 PDZ-binding domain-containing protein n=1 Tax=Chelonoidis abingdonii TaxID=106734 RepID=A0A8C0GBU1_CHEAB
SPGLSAEDMSWIKNEIATYAERNAALRVVLGSKEEEISRSKVTLQAFQEEREKLQRKVCMTTCPSLGSSGSQPCPFQSDPRQCRASHPRCIERLKGLNQLLSGTLRERKGHSERLSMLLGQHESNSTALHLAMQYSERCMEAYEVLLPLAGVKLGPWLEPVEEGDTLDKGESLQLVPSDPAATKRSSLWGWQLRGGRGEPIARPCPRGEGGTGCQEPGALPAKDAPAWGAGAHHGPGPATRCCLPDGTSLWPQEAMADLKIQLHLAEKETRGLELCTYMHRAQEAAHLLLIEHLQGELDELRGRCPSSGSSSSGDSTSCSSCLGVRRAGQVPAPEPTSLRSALVLAYRNARRKQEAQLQRLEAQMGAMGERHREQLRSLTQAVQRLEEQRMAAAGSETFI